MTSWAMQLKDAFQNIKTLDPCNPDDVDRWEEQISAQLRFPPRPREISDSITWAIKNLPMEEFRFQPPGPLDVASWVNRKRHEESERQAQENRENFKGYRPLTDKEKDEFRAAIHACVLTMRDKQYEADSIVQGYVMLNDGDKEQPTDEFWDGKEWKQLGNAAVDLQGRPVVFRAYKHCSVRRRP